MKDVASPLADLFPEGDYRFHLTLRRGEMADFFRLFASSPEVLKERNRWLSAEPKRYAALLPEGVPLLAEFRELVATWPRSEGASDDLRLTGTPDLSTVVTLGSRLEPDFLLMAPDASGTFRLVAGAVAFPSGWALEEKVGHSLDFIHGVVPGLNDALASPIQQVLRRMKPGPAFLRSNWGLAATDELNLHPARRISSPVLPLQLDRLWLRVEHQALSVLPTTGGVLFGIRIELYRLDEIIRDSVVRSGLRRALVSMPEPMALYKGIAAIRAALAEVLQKS